MAANLSRKDIKNIKRQTKLMVKHYKNASSILNNTMFFTDWKFMKRFRVRRALRKIEREKTGFEKCLKAFSVSYNKNPDEAFKVHHKVLIEKGTFPKKDFLDDCERRENRFKEFLEATSKQEQKNNWHHTYSPLKKIIKGNRDIFLNKEKSNRAEKNKEKDVQPSMSQLSFNKPMNNNAQITTKVNMISSPVQAKNITSSVSKLSRGM